MTKHIHPCGFCGVIECDGDCPEAEKDAAMTAPRMTPTNDAPVTVEEFWSRVDRKGPDDCWEWQGSHAGRGYGTYAGRRATHIALELDGRPRPEKLMALHSCDNPPCVNPAHLRWGTSAENVADMTSRKRHHSNRRTHCIHGHPLSGDNLLMRRVHQRECRTCKNIRNAAYNAKPGIRDRENAQRKALRAARRLALQSPPTTDQEAGQ